MSEDAASEEAPPPKNNVLRPYEDARAIVRLFQCALCSYLVREPLTLPCGQSICRSCLPEPHTRENITYPQNAERAQGFLCPCEGCESEHSVADCSLDVTLNKIIDQVKTLVHAAASKEDVIRLRLDEQVHWRSLAESRMDVMPRSGIFPGGRIVAAFTMASNGELNHKSELSFTPHNPMQGSPDHDLDLAFAQPLRETIRGELECHVCYGLMVDPLTTTCGHTFCRKCVARVLDHSTLCPACRRPLLSMRPGVASESPNRRICALTQAFLADELAARLAAAEEEELIRGESGWMPLFPCTLAFPSMPTFLHIFEPRYRLMVRRCLENGTRKFGMLMYTNQRRNHNQLGYTQYGTALFIQRVEILQDGRSLLETTGMYRFRVLEGSVLDGYHIGRIQRVEDMPLAEEEAIEAQETSGPEPDSNDFEARINHMSTQALLQHGLDFIEQARSRSADWLHERVLTAYGQPPNDAATFPFWFATVLPIHDQEKYHLLPSTSVRERLKMTARWIKALEQVRCARERYLRLARSLQQHVSALSTTQTASDQTNGTSSEHESPQRQPTSEPTSESSNITNHDDIHDDDVANDSDRDHHHSQSPSP